MDHLNTIINPFSGQSMRRVWKVTSDQSVKGINTQGAAGDEPCLTADRNAQTEHLKRDAGVCEHENDAQVQDTASFRQMGIVQDTGQ